MTNCKLCGLEKPLINAHIIPKQLYKPIRQASSGVPPSDQVPWLHEIGSDKSSKQIQNGISDKHILCRECDGDLIGGWDNYGQTLLRSSLDPTKYTLDITDKSTSHKIETFDYKQFKLLFMSMLWRAAVTSNDFFAQVKLGAWEEKLKKMILAQDPGSKNDFSVVLFKYEGKLSEIMQNPTRQKQNGVNYYRFRFPNYGFIIKVDQRNFSSELARYILNHNQPLLIPVRDYVDSKEYKQILDIRDKIPN